MATHTVGRAKHATLTGGAEDIVNFADNASNVMVANRSATNPIYFRVDGGAVTVAGDNTYLVMPNSSLTVGMNQGRQVRLISAGAQDFSVVAL